MWTPNALHALLYSFPTVLSSLSGTNLHITDRMKPRTPSVEVIAEKVGMHHLAKSREPRWYSVNDFNDTAICDLMEDNLNVLKLANSSNFIYYDANEQKWFLQEFEILPKKESLVRRPLTWCYDATDGHGGTITPSFELSFSTGQNFAWEFGAGFLGIGWNLGLSEKVTFKGTYSCEVASGNYAQVYLRPLYYVIPKGMKRELSCSSKRITSESKRRQPLMTGNCQETSSFRIFSNGAPIIECAIASTPEVCNVPF